MVYCLKRRKNYNLVTEFILINLSDTEIDELLESYPTEFYKKLDPTNFFNPGVGRTSKLKNWK